jgi:hypothetical protein
MYTHVSKCKTDTCWDCCWNWEMRNERQQLRGWIQVWYIWYIIRTFVNTPMYSYPARQQKDTWVTMTIIITRITYKFMKAKHCFLLIVRGTQHLLLRSKLNRAVFFLRSKTKCFQIPKWLNPFGWIGFLFCWDCINQCEGIYHIMIEMAFKQPARQCCHSICCTNISFRDQH